MPDTLLTDPTAVLDPISVDHATKANAWDAYTQAKSPDEFKARFDKLALPDSAKADLWDMKFKGGIKALSGLTSPAMSQEPTPQVSAPAPVDPSGFLPGTLIPEDNAQLQPEAPPTTLAVARVPLATPAPVAPDANKPRLVTAEEAGIDQPVKGPAMVSTARFPDTSPTTEPTFSEARGMAAKQVSDAVDENLPFLVGPFRVHAGIIKAAAQMATDPVNLGITAATGGLGMVPGIAGRTLSTGLSAYFATEAGRQFLHDVPEVAHKVAAGDWQGAAEAGGGALANAVMAYGAAHHAIEGVKQARADAATIRANMAAAKPVTGEVVPPFDPYRGVQQVGSAEAPVTFEQPAESGQPVAPEPSPQPAPPEPEPLQPNQTADWLSQPRDSAVPISTDQGPALLHPTEVVNGLQHVTITDEAGEPMVIGTPDVVGNWMEAHAQKGAQPPAAEPTQPAPKPQPVVNSPEFIRAHNTWNTARIKAIAKYMQENPGADEATATQATAGTYGIEPQLGDYKAPPAPPEPPAPAPKPEPPPKVGKVSEATPNAPTAATPTEPESPQTIALQIQQLGKFGEPQQAGQRRVVMFPGGQGMPDLSTLGGLAVTNDGLGNNYVYRKDLIDSGAIRRAAHSNTLPSILGHAVAGMGAPDKSALQGEPIAVTAHAPDGTEVQTAATDAVSLPATVAAAHAVTPEGGHVTVGSPEEALAGRRGEAGNVVTMPPFVGSARAGDVLPPEEIVDIAKTLGIANPDIVAALSIDELHQMATEDQADIAEHLGQSAPRRANVVPIRDSVDSRELRAQAIGADNALADVRQLAAAAASDDDTIADKGQSDIDRAYSKGTPEYRKAVNAELAKVHGLIPPEVQEAPDGYLRHVDFDSGQLTPESPKYDTSEIPWEEMARASVDAAKELREDVYEKLAAVEPMLLPSPAAVPARTRTSRELANAAKEQGVDATQFDTKTVQGRKDLSEAVEAAKTLPRPEDIPPTAEEIASATEANDQAAVDAIPEPTASAPIEIIQADAFPPTVADAPQDEPGHIKLANAVLRKLQNGDSLGNNVEFQRIADEAFGGSRATGAYDMKQAYDALEAAVNRYVADSIGPDLLTDDPRYAIGKLRELLKRLPTQNVRTENQELLQQFSTPPTLSYLAARIAAILQSDVVLEPSAGTGSLAAWAKAAGAIVHTNEIDPRRSQLLDYAIRGNVPTAVDAEYLHAVLPQGILPTVVIMNPPFSSTGGRLSANKNKFGYAHVLEALKRLQPGGRLVAILGEGATPSSPTAQEFWKAILRYGTLRANVSMNGQEYMKYGTTFGNRMIVIDKVQPSTDNMPVTGDYNSVEEAYDALQPVIGQRSAALARPDQSVHGATGPEQPVPGERGGGVESAVSGQTPAGIPAGESPGGVSTAGGQEPEPRPAEQPAVANSPGDVGGRSGSSVEESAAEPLRPDDRVALESRKKEDLLERTEDDSSFVEYVPSIEGLAHPGRLVETKVMASVNPPPVTYSPNLPKTSNLGRTLTAEQKEKFKPLSAAQMESVARAGQIHQQFNEDGQRLGFLLGDGTGVGKGQQIAAIIWDRNRSGQKKALWVSASKGLQKDAKRDFAGIGAVALTEKLFSINDWTAADAINLPEGVVFSTYNSLIAKAQGEKGQTRLDQLKKWLGEDGIIIFDESQRSKNAVTSEGSRAVSSKTGENVVKLQNELPKAYVVYASATAATDVSNLGYMTRMGLWGKGTPFHQGFSHFMSEVGSGGIAAMELIAREMKASGKYLSRSISYKGVKYGETIHELTPDQRGTYDSAARGWQLVYNAAMDQLRENNADAAAKGGFNQRYWGEHQRFFRKLLTAMKIPTVLNLADEAITNGKSIVISIIGTGQAQTDRAIKSGAVESEDDLDFSPKDALIQMIRESFPTILYEDYDDPETDKPKKRQVIRDGKPVQNPEAVARRDDIISDLNRDLALPDNPLDYIVRHYGRQKVAELTSRKRTIERNSHTGKWELVSRAPEGIPLDKINEYEMEQFQAGNKDVAIISKASGAGFSLHADLGAKNQRPRLHIVLELSWSADDQMQSFGRTHRSNQKQPPEYEIVSTDAGGEKRFSSSIARRLESLGALTKGQRDASGGGSVLAKYNFETAQGEQAAKSFYDYLLESDPTLEGSQYTGHQILQQMGMLRQKTDDAGNPEGDPYIQNEDKTNVTRLMNRVLNVELGDAPDNSQNAAFGLFTNLFDQAVQRAIESGTLDTGVNLVRGEHIRLLRAKPIAKDPTSGAETFRYTIEVEKKTRPVPASVVRDLKDKGRGVMMKRREFKGATEPDQLVWVQRSQMPITDRNGKVEKAYLTFGPSDRGEKLYELVSESDLNLNWEPMEGDSARYELGSIDKSIPDMERTVKSHEEAAKQGQYSSVEYYKKELARLKDRRKELVGQIKAAKTGQFDLWDAAYDAAPKNKIERLDMIGGSVMRVWPMLQVGHGRMDIRIAYPDSGGSITGIAMGEGDANAVEQSLTGEKLERTPSSVFDTTLKGKETFNLVGGVRLTQGRINRQPVIEVVTNDYHSQRFIDKLDIPKEKIGWQYRSYIPSDPKVGLPLLEAILKQFPIQSRPEFSSDWASAPGETDQPGMSGPIPAEYRNGVVFVSRKGMMKLGELWDHPDITGLRFVTPSQASMVGTHLLADPEMRPLAKLILQHVMEKNGLIVVSSSEALDFVKKTIRHEKFHQGQSQLSGHLGVREASFLNHPLSQLAIEMLRQLGYGSDEFATEIGSHLAAGDFEKMGLTRAQGQTLWRIYSTTLRAIHGDAAVDSILKGVHPSLIREVRNEQAQTTVAGENRIDTAEPAGGTRSLEGEPGGLRRLVRPDVPEKPEFSRRPEEPERSSVTLGSGFGALQPSLEAFYERDIKPAAKAVSRTFTGAIDDLKKVFAPDLRGALAMRTAGLLRERGGEMDQRRDRALALLTGMKKYFLKMPEQQGFHGLDVWDAIEGGRIGPWLSATDLAFARAARALLELRWQELNRLGILNRYVENYLPREWKDPAAATNWVQNWQAKRPLAGSEAFKKQRTYPTLKEGLDDPDFTLVPKFDNPVDMLMSKLGQMDQSITAHKVFNEMHQKGDIKYMASGSKPPVGWQKLDDRIFTVYGPPTGAVSIYPFKQEPKPLRSDFGHGPGRWHLTPEEAKEYQTALKDWRDTNVLPDDVRVHGQRIMGYYYAPEPVARVVNNYLSRSIDSSDFVKGVRAINNFMNGVQLSMSWYHGLTTAFNSSFSDMALGIEQGLSGHPGRGAASIGKGLVPFASMVEDIFKGTEILKAWKMQPSEFAQLRSTDPTTWAIVDALKAAGGKAGLDSYYQGDFIDAIKDELSRSNYGGALLRTVPAIAQYIMKPIMEYLVPRVKLSAFAKLMAAELERNQTYDRDELRQAAGQIWNSVDNRFGQLAQRNMMMHSLARTAVNIAFGRPGWNIGAIQEIVGGALDAGGNVKDLLSGRSTKISHKTAYLLALLIGGALINAITSFIMSGDKPDKLVDYIAPKDGGVTEDGRSSRFIYPTYLSKDMYSYGTRPDATLLAKASPILTLTANLFRNRDFYDRKIYGDRGIGVLNYLREQVTPYALTGLFKNQERRAPLGKQILPLVGIMPASKRVGLSKAERMITEYQDEQEANTRAPSGQRNKDKQEIFLTARTNPKAAYALGQKYVKEGRIAPADINRSVQRARQNPLLADYKGVSDFPTAMRIYDAATDDEKKLLKQDATHKANVAAARPWEWKTPDGDPDTATINLAWKYFHVGPGPSSDRSAGRHIMVIPGTPSVQYPAPIQ